MTRLLFLVFLASCVYLTQLHPPVADARPVTESHHTGRKHKKRHDSKHGAKKKHRPATDKKHKKTKATDKKHKKPKKKHTNKKKKDSRSRRSRPEMAYELPEELIALPDFFGGDKGLSQAMGSYRSLNRLDDIAKYHLQMQSVRSFCSELRQRHLFTCFLLDAGPWTYLDESMQYATGMGGFCMAAIIRPVEGAVVLSGCTAHEDYTLDQCKKLTFTKDKVDRYYAFKVPLSDVSFEIFHICSRCRFWHADSPDVTYNLFPTMLDLPGPEGIALQQEYKAVIYEYFWQSADYVSLMEKLVKDFPNDKETAKRYGLRYLYLYAFWASVLNVNGFEHRDFHSFNVMMNYEQIYKNFGELEYIGLNHFYAIDLDTMKFPKAIPNRDSVEMRLEKIVTQGYRPDSQSVSMGVIDFIEAFDPGYQATYEAYYPDYCLEDDVNNYCPLADVVKANKFILRFAQEYNEKHGLDALQGLHPPDAVDEFEFHC